MIFNIGTESDISSNSHCYFYRNINQQRTMIGTVAIPSIRKYTGWNIVMQHTLIHD
jgi:hypothetical protein